MFLLMSVCFISLHTHIVKNIHVADTQLQHGQGSAVEPTSSLPQSHHTEARKSWQQQMRPFQLAAVDQTERLWQACNVSWRSCLDA